MKNVRNLIICAIVSTFIGILPAYADPAIDPESGDTPIANQDPFESFNRVMFQFNEVVDKIVLRPLATLYITVVPKPVSKMISNFYNNIDTIPTVLNDILQLNIYQAANDAWRLGINSTLGILGFFDVATPMGLEYNKEDFGLTMAQWGYTNSSYLVLPFLGPGTVRDQAGWLLNYQFLSIYPYIYPIRTRYTLYFTGVVVRRAEYLRYQNLYNQAAVDKYVFMRNAYLQHRAYLIERNKELGDPYLEKDDDASSSSPPALQPPSATSPG